MLKKFEACEDKLMRIGIDARFLGPKGIGLGRYVFELIVNLEKIDKKNEYIIFLRAENFDFYNPKNKNFKKKIADVSWYSLKEQLLLPPIIAKERLDLLHVPHFNIPIFYPGKIIVTIHDIIKSEFASLSATTRSSIIYFLKHLAYELILKIAIFRSRHVFVPSNDVAQKLIDKFKISKEKISVTYESSSFKQVNLNGERILKKYKIKKPYLIYVGNAYPHKNLEGIFAALKILTDQKIDIRLINPCPRDVFYKRLTRKAKELGLSDKVILPGFVPDDDLIALYQEAAAFVTATFSEGFGIPGLEAMSLGTPVVCSDIPILREIYGDAALFFDPKNPKDIAEKVNLILTDIRLKQKLILKGKVQVKKYSWQKMAKETLRVYKEVLSRWK